MSIRAPVGELNVADRIYGIGRGLCAVRPQQVNQRFLWWLLSSQVEVMRSVSVGSTYDAITGEDLGNLRVSLPSEHDQRAIADYLDHETARLDALIEKKRRMMELAEARQSAMIEDRIRRLADTWGVRPLKFVVRRVEVGIVIKPSEWYAEEGVTTIRGFNVKPGRITRKDLATISYEGDRLHSKSRLREGDVVVVRTGQAGAAAVVPAEFDGCNCIDVVIIRPSRMMMSKYLELVLNSDWTQKHIDEHSVGTIQAHFNVGAMKQVPVPVPSFAEQESAIADLVAVIRTQEHLNDTLAGQVRLLVEHREALITATVTGQLAISGRAG